MRTEATTGHVEAILQSLHQHRILGNAAEEDLRALIRRSQLVIVSAREPLFAEGDAAAAVAVVLQGFVKLSSTTASGREVVLEVCGPGSMFGELAVLNDWPRAADAIALSSCKILSIDGQAFRAMLVHSPPIMFALINVISRRLREATEQVRDGADLPGPARLAKALGQLAASHGEPVGDGLRIAVNLSQRELGALTGLARESINKQLATWRDSKWLKLSGRGITVLDAEALRKIAFEGHAPDR